MSRYRFINLFDKIFVSVSIFLIIYAWINFFIRDLYTTFVLSVVFSFACVFLIYYLINKKKSKAQLSKKTLQDIEENFLAFKLLPKMEQLNLLKKTLSTNCEVIENLNALLYTKDDEKNIIIIATHIEKITQNDIINLINEFTNLHVQKIEIICNDFMPNLKLNFIKDLTIKLISKTTLYNDFFLKNNIFPNRENINIKSTKPSMKDIAKNFFLPHKSKSYFLCGLVLIFSGIILPYHFYYLIFGTTLLIFSILCKILSHISR